MLKEFKEFAMRGNVMDMAVGIIIGAAFGKIVTSLVNDIIMPPIGLLMGNVDFSNLFVNLSLDSEYASVTAAEAAGASITEHRPVSAISSHAGRIDGVVLADGVQIAADVVVFAAGAWSRSIGGIPAELRPPVRPIKGQMLALRMDTAAPLLNHVVWAPGAYLVPRRDGRLLVGATVDCAAGGVAGACASGCRVHINPIPSTASMFRERDMTNSIGSG